MRTAMLVVLVTLAAIGTTTGMVRPQQVRLPEPPLQSEKQGNLEILRVRPNFYMIAGASGNVAVQVGPDGAVVVDSGSAEQTGDVIAAVKRISFQPIRYLINTSAKPEHVGGNEQIAKAGQTLFNLNTNAQNTAMTNGGAAAIVAAEEVLSRLSGLTGGKPLLPTAAWPTETFHQGRRSMYLNGEGIELLHQRAAVTDGDIFVFFRRSDVVVAGDILDITRFPVIEINNGGSIQGEIDALNKLVELVIPSIPMDWLEEGTLVIGGHGRVCDQVEVVEYRDMVTIIRDRIRELVTQGKTLEQVKAANPTAGYAKRYGSDTGSWTTAMFVEAVYTSLAMSAEKRK
jgi:cyclase